MTCRMRPFVPHGVHVVRWVMLGGYALLVGQHWPACKLFPFVPVNIILVPVKSYSPLVSRPTETFGAGVYWMGTLQTSITQTHVVIKPRNHPL